MSSFATLVSLFGLVALDAVLAVPIPGGQVQSPGSACNTEGHVICGGSTYQTCASGIWSLEQPLAAGTDCSVFGSLLSGSLLSGGTDTSPVLPVTAPQAAIPAPQAAIPAVPVPASPAPAPSTPSTSQPDEPTVNSNPTQPAPASPNGDFLGSSGEANTLPLQAYSGSVSQFPPESSWITFDHMWDLNGPVCAQVNGPANAQLIHDDILKAASTFGVDARVILAVILEESTCRLNVPTTSNAVSNPGLMQSHNGVGFDGTAASVYQMIQDGTDGTLSLGPELGGDGLKQLIDRFGVYPGLRAYNSGENGIDMADLSSAPTGKASYVSDIANRLVGAMVAR